MVSVIWVLPGAWAMRLGIMKGTLTSGLPRAGNTSPLGSLSCSSKVFGSRAVMEATIAISFWPTASREAQRWIEAMQSSAVTGRPSCHVNPSRRVKV